MAAVSAPARAPTVAWGHAVAGTATGTSFGVPRGGGPSPPLEARVALPANIAGQLVRGDEGDPVKLLGLLCPPRLPWQEPYFRSAKLLIFAIGAGSG